jgi:hypothetical protein
MHRLVLGAGIAGVTLLAVACGSGAAATTSNGAAGTADPSASASPGARGLGRNGTAGELVQVTGTTLILNTQQGDAKVTFTPTTPVSKTSTATLADIAPGVCLVASGQKDSAGTITADTVNLTDAVNGSCAGNPAPGGAGGGSPNPSFSPNPNRTPPAGQQNVGRARGQVTAVSGVSVTLTQVGGTATGQPLTITVPTTVTVQKTSSAALADLAVGACVAAIGQKDSSGTVAARSLSIVPAGPTGCFTGGRGGGFGGGFGGGGFGGGGGGGGAATGNG